MIKKNRFAVMIVINSALFAAVVSVCFYMQVVNTGEFTKKAEAISSFYVRLPAMRGEITDRHGLPLAVNRLCLSVEISKSLSSDDISSLCKILKTEPENFQTGNYKLPYIAAHDIGSDVASAVSERGIDGVKVISEYPRDYGASPNLSHVIGYVGAITAEEYERGEDYSYDDIVGKDGVEKLNEPQLRGTDGQKILRRGKLVSEKEADHGDDITLTIDKRLQQAAESELELAVKTVEKKTGFVSGGAVVILDVRTGEVLAMASYPDFDPAALAENYTQLLEDEANPLLNRCISGIYEPGSTFKPIVALAALNEGVITADEEIEDGGIYTYYAPNYAPTCHIWNEKRKTHGNVNAAKALSVSCNYYFYDIGRRCGIEKISEYAQSFSLGEKTGIELYGEAEGTVACPQNKEPWYSGDTLQASIGQSVNMYTPLQLASFTSAIANGGRIYTPHIIKTEKQPGYTDVLNIKEEHYETVREGMRKCVLEGTASSSFENAEFSAGGKTGTAQVPKGPENGLFIGFAPFEKPEIAISAVIEHGSGSYAADLSSKLMGKYMKLKNF